MLTTNKKNLRARARTTVKGLTIDPRFAQDFFKPSTATVILEDSPQNDQPLLGGRNDKHDSQRKVGLKGLTVDTKLARETCNAENSGIPANVRLARKVSYVESPRLSEAMLNNNWRKHRHPLEVSSPEQLWSAPPEQSKFIGAVKAKPCRDDEHQAIDYAHSLERTAYRSRRPEEVKPHLIPFTKPESVSADLCLSAPATKTEFSTAETGTDKCSAKFDPGIVQPSIKTLVRLNEMAPTKRAGYENILSWDEQNACNTRRRLNDSSSITIVSLADSPESWETIDFPYAEIRAVKGDMRFERELSNVEETIRNQLSALVEPHSAGLPPEYLRKEYDEIREERRKAISFAQSTLEARSRRGRVVSDSIAPSAETPSDTHFNNLLGKLNKLCAPRLRAFTVNDKDNSNGRDRSKSPEKGMKVDPQSPSGDSGIGGLFPKGRQRSSTLNPKAIEFHCTGQEQQCTVSIEPKQAVSSPAVTMNLVQASDQPSESMDPLRVLETRVAELEAQIARQGSSQDQFARQRWGKGYRTNQASYKVTGPAAHGGGILHPGVNRNLPGPADYQTAFLTPPGPSIPNFAIGAGGVGANPIPATGYCTLPHNAQGFIPNGMPNGFLNQINPPRPSIPFGGNGVMMPNPPATGTPLWVKNMFGPKPVSKPDRPFRPGDGVQAVRQQEYEEYLEHLRATDPTYALSCKQRQARRADRQRSGAQKVLC
ncbi:hypothetical protein F5B22DRAFT_509271 [Xylaria bambusicola]|uniref:uncharacterized protein n=1 Tax=Xylaria bambusicola TaxID=326684 RepID=UPI0020076DF8|nr:uncharacterized protein F5B22DRAFT_509271 [Xylaria bambusicola]KAI0521898.1 hypothetical protein F5B22DRAFT_509271 [Xylaria bambusicola]